MNIIVGITGGIACYKACDLITGLKAQGHDVRVIMTDSATKFITPLTLSTLSNHPVMNDMWVERNGLVEHIEVAKWSEIFVVYPATANIIAKFSCGIADDLLSTVYLALPKKTIKIVFPAMNTNMLEHFTTVRNIEMLKVHGTWVAATIETKLACGDVGNGGVMKPRDAIEFINMVIEKKRG